MRPQEAIAGRESSRMQGDVGLAELEGITAHPCGNIQVGVHPGGALHSRLSKQLVLQHNLRKTIYIKDLDRRVTEGALVGLFGKFGEVLDCRICADGNSAMSFAFVEFRHSGSAENALARRPFKLGSLLLKVLPSKTAIVPVNADLMPKNTLEAERCGRTIYATNIDKRVEKIDVRKFFEGLCGPVNRLRLLGNSAHSTGIAFVEFTTADSAAVALNCSGLFLGATPLRVSPSKTPVRCPDDEEFFP